jgi:hypothetical protein
MSHLLIQQNELVHQFGADTELIDLISHFEQEFEKKGEVICKVRVNDLPLNEAEEKKFGSTPIKYIQSFEIETENPGELIYDVLFKWKSELPTLIASADNISQKMRFNGLESSYLHFSQFIDACHFLVSSLASIRTLVGENSLVGVEEWTDAEKLLWRCFDDLMAAFNSKNDTLIADIIEYDLAEALQTWLNLLNKIPERA